MVVMEPKKRSSCGRGVLKLKSWQPLPRPPGKLTTNTTGASSSNNNIITTRPATIKSDTKIDQTDKKDFQNDNVTKNNENSNNNVAKKNKQLVLVKYTYIANPDSPGGFDELTIKQGDKIYFHSAHPQNPLWVKAETQEGVVGYVPAKYIMELKQKPTSLPWLENRRLELEAEKQAEIEKQKAQGAKGFGAPKPDSLAPRAYISAYDAKASAQASEYGCEICGKTFNGPLPYRMHMSSKAHREEVEDQKYR